MRLFFAIWPPRAAAEALHAWALKAQRACGGRVTRADMIHLTLAFLGEADEAQLPVLKTMAIYDKRHALPIEQAQYWKHNRIVWVGPQAAPPALEVLVSSLNGFLQKTGFRTESRKFAAHITLIRNARVAGELPRLPVLDWPVEAFVLVSSQLAAAGPRYEVLQRYPLG